MCHFGGRFQIEEETSPPQDRTAKRGWMAGFGAAFGAIALAAASYCVKILGVAVLGAAVFGTGTALVAAQTYAAQTQTSQGQTPTTQTPYKAQFPGDPARSDSEAQALGYMRVVLRAQNVYKKRHNKYAESLQELAGTGSFTKRMAATTDRGDYTVSFRSKLEGDHEKFILTMTPKHLDSEHRSFYAEDDGGIHADDQKAADMESPKIR